MDHQCLKNQVKSPSIVSRPFIRLGWGWGCDTYSFENPKSPNRISTMSKPSNLIPNLNEIMEEYTEIERELVQEAQSRAVQEEERLETRTKTEQPTEKTRKRKRGDEEAETEQREEKVSDFVSECAYFAWRDKLQHKDFFGERGFNKIISPFIEMIEKRGCQLLGEHKGPGFVALVKEFYVNMVGVKGKTDRTRPGYPSRVPRVVPPSGVPLYNY